VTFAFPLSTRSLVPFAATILSLAASCTDLEEPSAEGTAENGLIGGPFPIPVGTAEEIQLQQLAAAEAPGLRRVGHTYAWALSPGQHAEVGVALQPNRCYAIFALSLDGITNLDLTLLTSVTPPLPPMVLTREAETTGHIATIGGRMSGAYCYRMPLAINAKVDITATSGNGTMAVQVYTTAQ